MVSAAKRAGLFQRKNVGGLFDHAEHVRCARGVRANIASLGGRQKSAPRTRTNGFPAIRDGARDLLRLIVLRAHDPESDSFRRARPDSRHLPQLRNQIPDCSRILRLSQSMCEFATANPSFGGFNPEAFPANAEPAAPTAANRIATVGRPLPPKLAPSGIPCLLLANAFRDREQLHSRRNLGGRCALVWPQPQARAVRKFRVDLPNSRPSKNRWDAQRSHWRPDQRCACQSKSS